MGKKSKRRRRRRKPPKPPTMPPTKASTTTESVKKELNFLEIVGLSLTVLGLLGLIGLRPRPSVSSSPPTDSDGWLRSRFTVTNDGYLQLNDVHAICFIWKARTTSSPEIDDDAVRAVDFPHLVLPPGQSLTVPCERTRSFGYSFKGVDLAVVLSYRPWPFTFLHQRRFFRFVARLNNETVVWDREPSADLEHEFDVLLNSNPQLANFK
jgi:hypothetical protein